MNHVIRRCRCIIECDKHVLLLCMKDLFILSIHHAVIFKNKNKQKMFVIHSKRWKFGLACIKKLHFSLLTVLSFFFFFFF